MSLLPQIFFPDDIRALQTSLRAAIEETDPVVKSCTALDDATRAAWGSFRQAVIGYCTVEVRGFGDLNFEASSLAVLGPVSVLMNSWGNSSAAFLERGKAYENEVVDWQEKLQSASCALAAPLHERPKEETGNSLADLANVAKWVAVLAGVGVGAYVVSKVVPLVAEGVGLTVHAVDEFGHSRQTHVRVGGRKAEKELRR